MIVAHHEVEAMPGDGGKPRTTVSLLWSQCSAAEAPKVEHTPCDFPKLVVQLDQEGQCQAVEDCVLKKTYGKNHCILLQLTSSVPTAIRTRTSAGKPGKAQPTSFGIATTYRKANPSSLLIKSSK